MGMLLKQKGNPFRRRLFFLLPEPVDVLDQEKYGKGNDNEVDDRVDEQSEVHGHGPGRFRRGQGSVRPRRLALPENGKDVGEIHVPQKQADGGMITSLTRNSRWARKRPDDDTHGMSSTFPFMANSLNSLNIFSSFSKRMVYLKSAPGPVLLPTVRGRMTYPKKHTAKPGATENHLSQSRGTGRCSGPKCLTA